MEVLVDYRPLLLILCAYYTQYYTHECSCLLHAILRVSIRAFHGVRSLVRVAIVGVNVPVHHLCA